MVRQLCIRSNLTLAFYSLSTFNKVVYTHLSCETLFDKKSDANMKTKNFFVIIPFQDKKKSSFESKSIFGSKFIFRSKLIFKSNPLLHQFFFFFFFFCLGPYFGLNSFFFFFASKVKIHFYIKNNL